MKQTYTAMGKWQEGRMIARHDRRPLSVHCRCAMRIAGHIGEKGSLRLLAANGAQPDR
jgi:hypothetical protein